MDDDKKPQLTKLDVPEVSRTYHFPNGSKVTLNNVTHLLCRPSGTHRLVTADGRKWIVPSGWIAIELDVEAWTL